MIKRGIQFVLLAVVVLGLLKVLFWWEVGAIAEEQVRYIRPGTGGARVVIPAGSQYTRGKIGSFFLGQHYRRLWATPVQAPVLQMNQPHRRLTVEKLGGGQQTTSFTLSDEEGRLFALRSVDKDPLPVLPPFWQKTIAGSFVRDQVSATHPYGALVVPVLAETVGIFHASPRLVFVPPATPQFREYPGLPRQKLYMIEEKYSSGASLPPAFGEAMGILDTREMLGKRFRKNNHHLDAALFARCRLLDLLIGDWDRHEGQWTWLAYKQGSKTLYKPIPKDRDQAFSHFGDGLVPSVVAALPPLRKFTSFRPDFDNIHGLTINASFLDERALPALSQADYEQIARSMQQALTDEVIGRAVRALPEAIYALSGAEMEATLQSRRDRLPEAALRFYRILARKVTVAGSDQEELFEVHRLNDRETRVRVYQLQGKNKAGELLYDRLFRHPETETITLHGLDGDDVITLTGKVREGIMVEVYGGRGEDRITDGSEVSGWRKKTVVYDTDQGNEITLGPSTQDRTTSEVSIHAYDREGH